MRTAHCDACRIMREEVTQRKLESLLSRLAVTQAPVESQYKAVKQLNNAQHQLRAAEDSLEHHQGEHHKKTTG